MPTVPGLERQVGLKPIDATPDPARGASIGAFGGFQAEALGSVSQALDNVSSSLHEMQVRRNKMQVDEGDIAYTNRIREIMYGTEETEGFLSLKGKDAIDNASSVAEQIRKAREEVIKEYGSSPAVKRQLSAILQRREGKTSEQIARYHMDQMDVYEQTLNEGRMKEAMDDAAMAYNDSEILNQSTVIVESIVHDMSDQQGWDSEITNHKLQEARSALYSGVVKSAIQRRDYQAARELWSALENKMDGPVAAQLREQMNQLVLIGEAQQEFDAYMSTGMTEEEMIKKVRMDLAHKPELRDEVERRVNNEWARKKREDARAMKEAKREAFGLLTDPDNPMSVGQVLENIDENKRNWLLSDGSTLQRMYDTERMVAEANLFATSTDGKTYAQLKRQPLRELAESDPNEYLGVLTRNEHNKFVTDVANAQRRLESGRDTAARLLDNQEADLARQLEGNDIFFEKGKPTNEFNLVLADLRNWVYEQIDEGNIPSDKEVKQKAAEFTTVVQHDTSWLPFTEQSTVIRDMTVEQARVATIDYDDIRPSLRRDVENELRDMGLDPTDRELVEGYTAAKAIAIVHPDARVKSEARERARTILSSAGVSFPTRPTGIRETIQRNEGRSSRVYNDSRGIPTVGVGFNLNRRDARERLSSVGANYDKVLSGEQELTNEQIDRLLEIDLRTAQRDASRFVSNFNSLSPSRQLVLVDMAYNMGASTLREFQQFKAAIERRDFEKAAQLILQSRYAQQVPNRAARNARLIREG